MDGLIEKKKKESRDKIITVAGDLFNRQGFESTTMDQIATEAAVARKTLYNYFPVKEAIADAYARKISKGLAQTASKKLSDLPDIRSRLIAAISNSYNWAEMNPKLTHIVLMYRFKNLLQATENKTENKFELTGSQSIILEILRKGQEQDEIRANIPVEMIFSYIDYLRTSTVLKWLKNDARGDLREEISLFVDLILNGASSNPGNIRNNE